MVEMALALPLLLIVLLGILDFGRALNYWLDENNLAAQGARWASVNKNPGTGTLQQYIKSQADANELKNGGSPSVPTAAQVCVSFPTNAATGTSAQVGDPIKVSVSTNYHWLAYVSSKIGIMQTTVAGSSTMRLETTPTTYSAGCA
jgi:Flp pilus assembly protein TadG